MGPYVVARFLDGQKTDPMVVATVTQRQVARGTPHIHKYVWVQRVDE